MGKICLNCKLDKPLKSFKSPSDRYYKNVCGTCNIRRQMAKYKLEMFENLGWKCACCGEDNPQFLSLDHINGGGDAHRQELRATSLAAMVMAIKREGWPKDKYQILCMNCNTAKGYYGECPHKKGITTEMAIQYLRDQVFSCR